jgi:hydrogenase nickel incorporation protein HypA/HybF
VHEFGLCEAILEAVERRAAGRNVLGIRVRIGARHQVVEGAFDQAFEMVSMGTVADGASVDWVILPVQMTCRTCGHVGESTDMWSTCATCGSSDIDVAGGDDLMLESIEVSPAPERVTNDRETQVVEGRIDGQ